MLRRHRRRQSMRLGPSVLDREVEDQANRRNVVVKAFRYLVGAQPFMRLGQRHVDAQEQFVCRHHVLPVAGVEVFERQFARAAHAAQLDAGAQRDQERHRVANRRAVGHVAAQRARIAHRQAGKAGGKALDVGPVLLQRGEGIGQRHGGADAQVAGTLFDAAQLGRLGDVQHLGKLAVLLGDPQAHVGATRHHLRQRVCRARCQQGRFRGRRNIGQIRL